MLETNMKYLMLFYTTAITHSFYSNGVLNVLR